MGTAQEQLEEVKARQSLLERPRTPEERAEIVAAAAAVSAERNGHSTHSVTPKKWARQLDPKEDVYAKLIGKTKWFRAMTATPTFGDTTMLVAGQLLSWATKDGQVFRSVEDLAKDIRKDPSTVKRHLKTLRDGGYLAVVTRGTRHTGATVYQMTVPEAPLQQLI